VLASGSGGNQWTIRLSAVGTSKEFGRFTGHVAEVTSLDISPDGGRLVSGSADSTGLIWDLKDVLAAKPGPARSLQPEELECLWAALAGADAAKAYRAMEELEGAPPQAVPLLRRHLTPAGPGDAPVRRRLIADLDSDQFAVREQATRKLEEQGESAEPALRNALKSRPSLEVRQRVERLLGRLSKAVPSAEVLRGLRSVELLERLGTPAAQGVLKTLVNGSPEAQLTQEAQASLERLAKRRRTN
jgi:hypothetical protein